MTTATEVAIPVGVPPLPARTIWTLGRFEARLMVKHRVVWLGAAASAGLAVFELWDQAPVLNRVSVNLAWTMLPLAVATTLVAGWAVLRARGKSDDHPPVTSPLEMGQRVGGIVLGLIGPATITFLVQILVLGWVFTRQPVTSLVWVEILAGPVYVVFAGSMGAVLTRWFPHSATPLFAALVLGAMMIALPYDQSNWGRLIGPEWLMPLAWPQDVIPYEVVFRPAGLHLVYLSCLTLLVGGVAMSGRSRFGWGLVILGLLGAALSGPAQLGPIPESRRVEAMSRLVGDQADLTCQTYDSVEYCAMPGYERWIHRWATATEPVIAAAPPSAMAGIEMRQYPVHNTFLLDGQPYNDWWWIAPSYEDYVSRDVVAVGSMAADWEELSWVAGLSNDIAGCAPWEACTGQGQQVVVLWLMTQSSRVRSYTIDDPQWGTDYATASECMVRELWTKPDPSTQILDNWDLLVGPQTTYEEAGDALGVSVPTGYDSDGVLVAGCP
jgi:hypothetical protein